MGQGHIGDACIEHLHECSQRNRNRNNPRVAFGLPDFLARGVSFGGAHRTITSGSTNKQEMNLRRPRLPLGSIDRACTSSSSSPPRHFPLDVDTRADELWASVQHCSQKSWSSPVDERDGTLSDRVCASALRAMPVLQLVLSSATHGPTNRPSSVHLC